MKEEGKRPPLSYLKSKIYRLKSNIWQLCINLGVLGIFFDELAARWNLIAH